MIRPLASLSLFLFCVAAPAPARANEEGGAPSKKESPALPGPPLPGLRHVPAHRATLSPIRPLTANGMKGVENYCGALASSADSARLAWQERRIRNLRADLAAKNAELDARTAEIRQWVSRREELLAKAGASLVAIYSKMKPDAASAQLQDMDDDTAAALLLKMKPAVASAVMSEMDAARAARLSDLLTGALAKSDGKKS